MRSRRVLARGNLPEPWTEGTEASRWPSTTCGAVAPLGRLIPRRTRSARVRDMWQQIGSRPRGAARPAADADRGLARDHAPQRARDVPLFQPTGNLYCVVIAHGESHILSWQQRRVRAMPLLSSAPVLGAVSCDYNAGFRFVCSAVRPPRSWLDRFKAPVY